MKNKKAILIYKPLKDVVSYCEENKMIYEERMNYYDNYVDEIRIDLNDLEETQLTILEKFIGSKEFYDYDYIIFYEAYSHRQGYGQRRKKGVIMSRQKDTFVIRLYYKTTIIVS